MMRSISGSFRGRRRFLTATWASFRHNFEKPVRNLVTTNIWLSAGTGRACTFRSTSALLDTVRDMATKKSIMEDRMVWLDMEMTGLDLETCHIIEIACLITNSDLEIVSDDFHLVLHQPDDILASMNSWCIEQHAKTGLTEASRTSKISLKEAEQLTYNFLATNIPEKKCPIVGNSVWMDRMFLRKYMPIVDDYAHYRIIDVSSVKELTRRWCPQEYKAAPKKEFNHRALDDIRESIAELKYYRSKIFNC